MIATNKRRLLDISVYNRGIKSIKEEKELTIHSLGYLDFLDEETNASVIRFGKNSEQKDNYYLYRYNFKDVLRVLQHINAQKPAIAIFHGFSFPIRFWLLHTFFGKKIKWIVQHHAGDPSPNSLKRMVQKWCYSKADRYMFVTKTQAQPFVKAGIVKSNAQVAEIMECSTAFTMQDKNECRKQLGLPLEKRIFLWVGNLDANKNPMCLLEAIHNLNQSGQDFLLYMFFAKTDLLYEVQQFVEQNQLQEKVFLKGKIPNNALETWYNAADFFISCSFSEGSGVALAEAMACGCVPIATDIPSFRHMTANSVAGAIFKTGSSSDLFEKLIAIQQENLEIERTKANRVFKEMLSFEAIGRQTSALAKEIMHQE
ncbi:MAG: glycosyltransferase [Flavobacterium sp.]|nr:glycosyltransferase [Flavobacterium sp.]